VSIEERGGKKTKLKKKLTNWENYPIRKNQAEKRKAVPVFGPLGKKWVGLGGTELKQNVFSEKYLSHEKGTRGKAATLFKKWEFTNLKGSESREKRALFRISTLIGDKVKGGCDRFR